MYYIKVASNVQPYGMALPYLDSKNWGHPPNRTY